MARDHWSNCITHLDAEVVKFVRSYFGEEGRRCLLVAAAGFDPRSQTIARMLSETLGDRLSGLFIREERGGPDADLQGQAELSTPADSLRLVRRVAARQGVGGGHAPAGDARPRARRA